MSLLSLMLSESWCLPRVAIRREAERHHDMDYWLQRIPMDQNGPMGRAERHVVGKNTVGWSCLC